MVRMVGTRPGELWVGAVDVEQMMNNMVGLWSPRMTDECVRAHPTCKARLNTTTKNKAALLGQVTVIILVCLLGMIAEVIAMDAQGAGAQSIRPPIFSGLAIDWPMFWLQLMAYATFKGFQAALGTEAEEDMPNAEEDADEDDEDAQAALTRNRHAMATLTQGLSKNRAFIGFLLRARSPAFPEGQAWVVVVALKERFEPDDMNTGVEIKKKLNRISMRATENPLTIYNQIENIEASHMNHPITETEKLTVIIDKVAKEYKPLITAEQRRLGDGFTTDELRKTLFQHWRTVYGTSADDGMTAMLTNDGTSAEVTLAAAPGGYRGNAGACWICGKKGHKQNDCPHKKNPHVVKGNDNQGTNSEPAHCFNCGLRGHVASNCWERAENAHLRPRNWTSRMKQGRKEAANCQIEYLFLSYKNPSELLKHPDIWIKTVEHRATPLGMQAV